MRETQVVQMQNLLRKTNNLVVQNEEVNLVQDEMMVTELAQVRNEQVVEVHQKQHELVQVHEMVAQVKLDRVAQQKVAIDSAVKNVLAVHAQVVRDLADDDKFLFFFS